MSNPDQGTSTEQAMSQADTERSEENAPATRVSILALVLSLPFLSVAFGTFVATDKFAANEKFRNGVHGVLGAPDDAYSFRNASTMLFLVPAAILIARAFFAPKTSQSIALAIGGFPASMIIASCFFGRTDACSMLLLGVISLGLLAYGFQSRSKIETRSTTAR